MTATLEAPVALPPAPPARAPRVGRPRGRRRTTVLVGAAVALAVAGTLALPATASLAVGGAAVVRGDVPVVSLPTYGARGAQVVGYAHGAEWVLEVPVRNDGPVPLVVTGAELGAGPFPLLQVERTDRLALAPGESGRLRVSGTAGHCRYYHERELWFAEQLRLDVAVLGRAASRDLRLERPILVHSPMIVGCPDRVLDRRRVNRR